MFCSKCGVQIEEGAVFCPNCGNPVAGSNVQNSYRKMGDTQPVQRKSKKRLIPLIAGVAVACIAVAFLLFMKLGDKVAIMKSYQLDDSGTVYEIAYTSEGLPNYFVFKNDIGYFSYEYDRKGFPEKIICEGETDRVEIVLRNRYSGRKLEEVAVISESEIFPTGWYPLLSNYIGYGNATIIYPDLKIVLKDGEVIEEHAAGTSTFYNDDGQISKFENYEEGTGEVLGFHVYNYDKYGMIESEHFWEFGGDDTTEYYEESVKDDEIHKIKGDDVYIYDKRHKLIRKELKSASAIVKYDENQNHISTSQKSPDGSYRYITKEYY